MPIMVRMLAIVVDPILMTSISHIFAISGDSLAHTLRNSPIVELYNTTRFARCFNVECCVAHFTLICYSIELTLRTGKWCTLFCCCFFSFFFMGFTLSWDTQYRSFSLSSMLCVNGLFLHAFIYSNEYYSDHRTLLNSVNIFNTILLAY